jgi:hypothetical protein
LKDQNKEREEEIDLGDEEEQEEIETSAARASERETQGLDKSDSQRRQVLVNNSVIILFYFNLISGPELTP